jgi:hypothetical protein
MQEQEALTFFNIAMGIPNANNAIEYQTRTGGSWLNVSVARKGEGVYACVTLGDASWHYEGPLEKHKQIERFTSCYDF